MQDSHGKIPIGVSFPVYNAKTHQLGHKLRLFADTEALLEQLNIQHCLNGLTDYVHLTSIRNIPKNNIKSHACYYRIQIKSSNERLARRKAKRKNISIEQSINGLEKYPEPRTDAPYINLTSQTNGECFRLFIGYIEQEESNNQGFSSYGLSKNSAVPVF